MPFYVIVTDNSSGDTETVSAEDGWNVEACCRAAFNDINLNAVTIRKNRESSTLCDTVRSGDRVTITRKDLKGAADDNPVANYSYEDLVLKSGTQNNVVGQDGAYALALKQVFDNAQQVATKQIASLMELGRHEGSRVNASIKEAEKTLANARTRKDHLAYAAVQLKGGNIFSMMAFLGIKDQAYDVCQDIGCEVPAASSPLWATAPPKTVV